MGFWEIKQTDQLEKEEDWKNAKELLNKKFSENPNDLKIFIKLSFLCWYVVVEWEVIDTINLNRLDYENFENTLKDLYKFGLSNFNEEPMFNCIFGLMISLFPFHFGGDYDELEKIGLDMINKSYLIDPSDPLIKLIYLGSPLYESDQEGEYVQFLKANSKELISRFKGEGILQEYIKDMTTIY